MSRSVKRSCPGCGRCYGILGDLGEIDEHWPVLGIDAVKNGRFYRLTTCNESRDQETGYLDGWDIKLVELDDEEVA
jgi:hypothetical protein